MKFHLWIALIGGKEHIQQRIPDLVEGWGDMNCQKRAQPLFGVSMGGGGGGGVSAIAEGKCKSDNA